MKYKHLAFTLGAILTSTVLLLFSCKKLNDATGLGGDLVPEVDNINTFDTTLDVLAFVDSFTLANDSTSYLSNYEHFIGRIDNDPFFGKTDARIFMELKPAFYPYYFMNRPDSLEIDSVVLVLNYVETFGDGSVPQTINVYEVAQSADFKPKSTLDSAYRLRTVDFPKAGLLGSRTVIPNALKDTVRVPWDTSANQLRIRLDNSFGQRLLDYDSAGNSGAYKKDSVFRTNFKGFALESTGGNAVIGVNLTGTNTKLAIYYRYEKNGAGNYIDTVGYFTLGGVNSTNPSATAQYARRDYSGSPFATVVGGTEPDPVVYIQSTPGSYATLKIPALPTLSNRVVHRAELIMEQIYDVSDTLFPNTNLFVDIYDPAISTFRTMPYDVFYDGGGNDNLVDFGITPQNKLDPGGKVVKVWKFNMTRYVQHVVNDTEPAYDLRLFAPVYTLDKYKPGTNVTPFTQFVQVNAAAVKGRVRLHGTADGSIPGANPQRMRLRIVYSKI